MATTSATLERKTLGEADEVRQFPNGKMVIIMLGGVKFGRATFEPGWRWTTHMKALVGTDTCQISHVGYIISGRLRVLMNDGKESEFGPGDFIRVGPGHDAWVVGEQPCEYLEVAGAAEYAMPHAH